MDSEHAMSFRFAFDIDDGDGPDNKEFISQDRDFSKDGFVSPESRIEPQSSRKGFVFLNTRELAGRQQQNVGFVHVPLFKEATRADISKTDETRALSTLKKVKKAMVARDSSGIVAQADIQQTDLVPGVYEGGLKLWECSIDLCRFLSKEKSLTPRHVLELGCGHGLPACLLLRKALIENQETSFLFCDYNDFVLQDVTLPNILANAQEISGGAPEFIAERVALGAGDWWAMSKALLQLDNGHGHTLLPCNGRFDVILASETIYSVQASRDVVKILLRHLVPQSGVALVAAKRFYFGVGGGCDAFRAAAEEERIEINNRAFKLSCETVELYDEGNGNIRELLKTTVQEADV